MEDAVLLMIYPVDFMFHIKKDGDLKMYDMVTRISESRSIVKQVSCDWICTSDGRKYNIKQK